MKFAGAFEHAAIGMALVGLDHQTLQVNQAFCDLLGYTRQELLSKPLHGLSPPEDGEEHLSQRMRMLEGEMDRCEQEHRVLHKSGRVLWGLFTSSLVRDAHGQPARFIVQAQDITARKLAEQALLASEERFFSLNMLSSDWFWDQDAQFRFTRFWTQASAGMLHACGKCRWELDGIDLSDPAWQEHRQLLEAHQPFRNFEYTRVADGVTHYYSVSGDPVFDAVGSFCGYRGIAREKTENRIAQQRLRDTQAMLHMAAQVGRLGAWEHDLDADRITWSDEVCAIHEVRRDFKPTRVETLAFFAPQSRRRMHELLRACEYDGTPFDVEAPATTAKGRSIWVRIIAEAQWDAQGRVRRIQGACQDISEAKQAAEHARLLAEQLTTTLESLTDAFFTVDRNWRFTYVNGEAERILRRSRAELLGRVMWQEYPGLRASSFPAQYQRALAQNVAVQFDEFHAPSGLWVQVKAYPSRQGLAIYAKDVTDRIKAQQEILRLNAELEERVRQRTAQLETANKELEAFSYSIAHDLRAPLSSIDGFSQMLERNAGTALDERCCHYLKRIRAGVSQMAELTDGLLALANLSRAQLRCESVDLAVVARGAAGSCRERSPDRDIEIDIAPTLPVEGDPRLLVQVIGNLVGNAWKFTAKTAAARIEVGSQVDPQGQCVYFVRDNGAGFDMAYAAKMFEAFQRMHTAAEFEGTGIGLAIVHKIIARHGGRIWAEAAPQRGACFYFTLNSSAALAGQSH